MNYKWYIYYEKPYLYLHRSWTGICIYRVKIRENDDNYEIIETLVNRNPEQYDNTDDQKDFDMLLKVFEFLFGEGRRFMNEWVIESGVRGSLLGLACGDALGSSVEFEPRGNFPPVTDMIGGGAFSLRPGEWTDDSAMALCLAESLIECKGIDPKDQMKRYCDWMNNGHMSSNGSCFDIGGTTEDALLRFQKTSEPFSGSSDPQNSGNGSIMRLAPVPIYYFPDLEKVVRYSAESSRTTHGAEECVDACKLLGFIIAKALAEYSKNDILFANDYLKEHGHVLCEKIRGMADGGYKDKPESEIRSDAYVVHTLEAALWCFYHTDSFEDAVLKAVNLGDDADTTGAVCGQIAGAYYGINNIPIRWFEKLAMKDQIFEIADKLCASKNQRK
jgi:ADP-ribosyl-[dinitrogen reductase] hydrolase